MKRMYLEQEPIFQACGNAEIDCIYHELLNGFYETLELTELLSSERGQHYKT